jgi:hypothetical protein
MRVFLENLVKFIGLIYITNKFWDGLAGKKTWDLVFESDNFNICRQILGSR